MSTNIFKQREKEYALERLRVLKGKYPEALEVLNFYEHILGIKGKPINLSRIRIGARA